MGTGKTTAIINLIKNNKNIKSVIYVSSWITFTHYITNKLNEELKEYGINFKWYNDNDAAEDNEPERSYKNFSSIYSPYIVC